MGTMYVLPSTSMVVLMPHALDQSLASSCFTLRCLLRFDLRYEPVVTQVISSSVYGIMFWIVPLFSTILSCCRSKRYCYLHMAVMHDGVGTGSTLALPVPWVPCSRVPVDYNSRERVMLPFISAVQKNLQPVVTLWGTRRRSS